MAIFELRKRSPKSQLRKRETASHAPTQDHGSRMDWCLNNRSGEQQSGPPAGTRFIEDIRGEFARAATVLRFEPNDSCILFGRCVGSCGALRLIGDSCHLALDGGGDDAAGSGLPDDHVACTAASEKCPNDLIQGKEEQIAAANSRSHRTASRSATIDHVDRGWGGGWGFGLWSSNIGTTRAEHGLRLVLLPQRVHAHNALDLARAV